MAFGTDPIRDQRVVGIDELGSFTGDAGGPFTDTSWGRTTEEGAVLQFATQIAELFSGQSLVQEDINPTRATASITTPLIVGELEAFLHTWGLPTTAAAGNLDHMTPVAEVLTIGPNDLGSREDRIYVEGPGPGTTRTLRAYRTKVSDFGPMQFAKTAWHTASATWSVLPDNTGAGNPVVDITDAP